MLPGVGEHTRSNQPDSLLSLFPSMPMHSPSARDAGPTVLVYFTATRASIESSGTFDSACSSFAQVAADRLRDVVLGDRLAEVGVHARRQTLLPISGHRGCGQGDDERLVHQV